jgi:hypothetical protein
MDKRARVNIAKSIFFGLNKDDPVIISAGEIREMMVEAIENAEDFIKRKCSTTDQ